MFYKICKQFNKIQLTKNKMDLNIRKMTNHPHESQKLGAPRGRDERCTGAYSSKDNDKNYYCTKYISIK